VITFLIVLLLIAACVAFGVQVARLRAERQVGADYELPPLVIPMASAGEWHSDPSVSPRSRDLDAIDHADGLEHLEPIHVDEQVARTNGNGNHVRNGRIAVVDLPGREPAEALRDKWAEPAPSHTVRFRRPSDDPLQLLPGRLEVVAGDSAQQEIRFVRVPGEQPQLILGREPGPAPHHVVLHSSTVSRRHARLFFADGRWSVVNLSQTNPVVVNDEPLPPDGRSRTLADGDRIELGEVVLRFCAR
jgi:hypothetical protein